MQAVRPRQARAARDFSASQSRLPDAVHARILEDIGPVRAAGSVLTLPFTGARFRTIRAAAEEHLRTLLDISDDFAVLFLQGGASAQFGLVPMNLAPPGAVADYVETGYWSRKAMDAAVGAVRVATAASSAQGGFDHVPPPADWRLTPGAAYVHVTDNETGDGVEHPDAPPTLPVPLVSDMTSNFLTRRVRLTAHGVIYAGAQKNLGVAGLTVVLVRRDLLGRAHAFTPAPFDYTQQDAACSMVNTPPTFAIYVAGLVFEWLLGQGGLPAMETAARSRSEALYAAIDGSEGFYRCRVQRAYRSRVSVCFDLADASLTPLFLLAAREEGLDGLAGHSRIGGLRAGLYNAVSQEDVAVLAEFMGDFRRRFQ
ncbi:MAG: 3-phosphoserine/phosphohydroxythreonine transaminase [Burkholderiales bacterium]|nr:3-phosphoserine/phosphohydroxythreonine transaminase [Burkholderiales bacterium]